CRYEFMFTCINFLYIVSLLVALPIYSSGSVLHPVRQSSLLFWAGWSVQPDAERRLHAERLRWRLRLIRHRHMPVLLTAIGTHYAARAGHGGELSGVAHPDDA